MAGDYKLNKLKKSELIDELDKLGVLPTHVKVDGKEEPFDEDSLKKAELLQMLIDAKKELEIDDESIEKKNKKLEEEGKAPEPTTDKEPESKSLKSEPKGKRNTDGFIEVNRAKRDELEENGELAGCVDKENGNFLVKVKK